MSEKSENIYLNTIKKGVELGVAQATKRKKIIAERLREIRIKSNMKQKDIADKIKMNVVTYSGYENERSFPPIELLIQIADAYNVSLDYLTGRTENYSGIGFKDDIHAEKEDQSFTELKDRIEKLESTIHKIKGSLE